MARKPRIEFAGAFYHVIARGNQRQKVFWAGNDYKDYLSKLKFYRDKFKFIIHAYCLMPNHVHLLLETKDIPLSKVMHGLQFSYTQAFNKRHKKIGHLFHGRYKAIICHKEAYLLELIRYIHLNPVRARLVRKPWEYPWNSHNEYIGEPTLIDENAIHLFGKRRLVAINNYKKFIQDGINDGHREEYYQLKDQRILGEDEFAEELVKRTDGWHGEYWNIERHEIIDKVCKEFETKPAHLNIIGKGRKEALVRGVAAFMMKKLCGTTLGDIGAVFNRKEQGMSYLLRCIEAKMKGSEEFSRRLALLERELLKNKRPLLVKEIKR